MDIYPAKMAAPSRNLFILLNAIKNIQNQCQGWVQLEMQFFVKKNHENIIQMTQWDRFEGFGIVGCKKSIQVRFKVLTENRKVGLSTLKFTFVQKEFCKKNESLSENICHHLL